MEKVKTRICDMCNWYVPKDSFCGLCRHEIKKVAKDDKECKFFVYNFSKDEAKNKEKVENIGEQQEEFVNFVVNTLEELKAQFLEKNKQYKTAADPLANFRRGAQLGMGACGYNEMYRTALGYENKHIVHVFNQSVYGNKVDESLKDIAIYSIIELYMVKKANEAK